MPRMTNKPWFGPKRYFGWGWSPASWEGWVVSGAALVLVILAMTLLSSGARTWAVVLVSAGLVAVAAATGGRPGGPDDVA